MFVLLNSIDDEPLISPPLAYLCPLLKCSTRDKIWFDADIKLIDGSEINGEAHNIRDQIVQVIVGEKVLTYSEGQIQEMWLKNGDNEHQFMLVALKNKFERVEYNLVEK